MAIAAWVQTIHVLMALSLVNIPNVLRITAAEVSTTKRTVLTTQTDSCSTRGATTQESQVTSGYIPRQSLESKHKRLLARLSIIGGCPFFSSRRLVNLFNYQAWPL